MSVPNQSQSDPYREPAALVATETAPPRRLIGVVAERMGLWRFAWVRRLLGGRWEKFLFIMWLAHEKPCWLPPATFSLGRWRRVPTWSVVGRRWSGFTEGWNWSDLGTMHCSSELGGNLVYEGCALVSYHREDHG